MCTTVACFHMCFISWPLAHRPTLNIYSKYLQLQISTSTSYMFSYIPVYTHAGSAKVRWVSVSHRVCCTAGRMVNPETQTPPSTPILHQHIHPSAFPMTSHSYAGSPEANMCVINSHTHAQVHTETHTHVWSRHSGLREREMHVRCH